NFPVHSLWIGLPAASVPSTVIFMLSPVASYLTVCAFGAGPGLYLDLATFTFQVPSDTSAASATPTTKHSAINPNAIVHRIIVLPQFLVKAALAYCGGMQ